MEFCTFSGGCGKRDAYRRVTGTVKFSDGTVPRGDIASVTFQPARGGTGTKGAQGTIAGDGTFHLHTIRPGDGALPGKYHVIVYVMKDYPEGTLVVPKQYANPKSTPLEATVEADGENHFDFKIERP